MEIYPFNEFLAHFADWGFVRDYHHVTIGSTTAPVTGQRDVTSSVLRARDYMQQKYGDTPEAAEKAKLFSLIQLYLAQHAKGFDRDSLLFAVLSRASSASTYCAPCITFSPASRSRRCGLIRQ
jgi:hypothetical protein